MEARRCAGVEAAGLDSIAHLALARGKRVGVVTTTRVTHATPAAAYARTPSRDWESDADMPAEAKAAGCVDIARQLMTSRFDVVLGGGWNRFLPRDGGGRRADGADLTADWIARGGVFVRDARGLAEAAGADAPLLGLFAADHLPYEADRATKGQGVPTLTEMSLAAVERLSRGKDGYFLLIEGGRIDHGHHENDARRALIETAAMADAVRAVLERVDLRDTLVIVTADHSHGLVLNGYAPRGTSVLGLAGPEGTPHVAADGLPYEILTYATGPGAAVRAARAAPSAQPDRLNQSLVPASSAAHSGEDVPVYAAGPWAHLVDGVMEQHWIHHVMRRAFGFDRPKRWWR